MRPSGNLPSNEVKPSFLVQLYAFLMKIKQQRLRSPASTLFTIFIPCLFIIGMCLSFWLTPSVLSPAMMYGASDPASIANTPSNISTSYQFLFCKSATATLALDFSPCMFPADQLTCLPNVGAGDELCVPTVMYAGATGALYSLYYGSGAFAVNSMESYLALSALTTYLSEGSNPTFFGRSGQASLSHYGSLLVVSDSASLKSSFVSFCETQSAMCKDILYTETNFTSLNEAEEYALSHPGTVWAIVYLPSSLLLTDSQDGVTGSSTSSDGVSSVPFTISMNYSATPWTFKHQVQNLFSKPQIGSAGYVLYWTSGFMTLQTFVQQFFLEQNVKQATTSVLAGPAKFSGTTDALDAVSTYLNQNGPAIVPMPTPATNDSSFLDQWGFYLPLVCALGALFPVSHLTALIVEEKPRGHRDMSMMMGMTPTCMFTGWYLFALLLDLVVALLASLFFKIGFLDKVSYGILFVLYFSFLQQNTALSMLLSSIFHNPRIASWCAALLVFILVMPYYSFPPGMTDSARFGASIVPCVGFSNALGMLVSYVTFSVDVNWTVAREVGVYFSVQDAIGMMWVSFVAMMLLAWYLEHVLPSVSRGHREHPLFFLRPLMWLCGARPPHGQTDRSEGEMDGSVMDLNADHDVERKEQDEFKDDYYFPRGASDTITSPGSPTSANYDSNAAPPSSLFFMEHYGEKVDLKDADVPVVLKDVCVTYVTGSLFGFFYTFFTGLFRKGDYRVALRNVSFALRRGEVSTLLGPNGSGKTTIMTLATNMQRPASGHIYISGEELLAGGGGGTDAWWSPGVGTDGSMVSRRNGHVGYCPQQNVIWEDMTVEEHFTFYARIKGVQEVSEEVEHLLEVTDLTPLRSRRTGHLSGGEKRRVCVGIALVGNPSVLFMDEPTAGLDVKCRRDVYEVLQRVREGRSILLSTHLLDEADQLGDRLLILSNGELCGEGSSLFLKSRTNVGYKLTCMMENKLSREEEEEAVTRLIAFVQEEGAKNVHHHAEVNPLPAVNDLYNGGNDVLEDVLVPPATVDSLSPPIPPGCPLLGLHRRGREVTFLFPLSLLTKGDSGQRLVTRLDEEKSSLRLSDVGISLTGLEDVLERTTLAQVGISPMGHVLSSPNDPHNSSGSLEMGLEEAEVEGGAVRVSPAIPRGCPFAAGGGGMQEPVGTGYTTTTTGMRAVGNTEGVRQDAEEDASLEKRGDGMVVMTTHGEDLYHGTSSSSSTGSSRRFHQHFARDFRAFFLKRLHSAKRDGRLIAFQVALPIIFLAMGLLINLAQAPLQPALTLDMQIYPGYTSNPSEVWISHSVNTPNAFQVTSDASWVDSQPLGKYYVPHVVLSANTTEDGTTTGGASSPAYLANDGLYTLNDGLLNTAFQHGSTPRYVGLSLSASISESVSTGSPGPGMNFSYYTNAVYHNLTYPHAAPQGINTLYQLAIRQIFGNATEPNIPVARNAPMKLGPFEKQLVDASKVVMVGMFVILPFVLIPANTIRYVVREKETGARHLQWLTGASMAAYWSSVFVFDFLCYIGTLILAYIVFLIFKRNEYYGPGMLGPSLCVFLLYGISSILSAYALSFFFSSPFKAQNTVLLVNFVFGFLWVTMESVIGSSALNFVRWASRFLRVIPAVSFGESLYVISGTNLARLMMPDVPIGSLFALLRFQDSTRSIFKGGVGTGLIYMGGMFCFSFVALTMLEMLRGARFPTWLSCRTDCERRCSSAPSTYPYGDEECEELEEDGPSAVVVDASVHQESQRVHELLHENGRAVKGLKRGGGTVVASTSSSPESAADDAIILEHVYKYYSNAHHSHSSSAVVNDVSLGVRRGEVLALLGLNGAGKSTILRMLCGDLKPSAGEVYMNHTSIQSEACRPFIGYCPQFDALLDDLNVEEHLYLYSRLRGMRESCIPAEVDYLTETMGLAPHRYQSASALSGGNRRRLSLSIALIGNTTSVLLDEATAGMDAFARYQTCAAIQRLAVNKSIILTTHLLDEAEALADRVAVLSRGQFSSIGTLQELRSRFSEAQEKMHTLRIHFPSHEAMQPEVLDALETYILSAPAPPGVSATNTGRNGETTPQWAAGETTVSLPASAHGPLVHPSGTRPLGVSTEAAGTSSRRVVRRAVLGSGVEFELYGVAMQGICTIVAALNENKVPRVPPIAYVSVSQPSLEDVLMAS